MAFMQGPTGCFLLNLLIQLLPTTKLHYTTLEENLGFHTLAGN